VQDKSWWTWGRLDGTRYYPSSIEALWRRVAERKDWQDAREEFGPLSELPDEGGTRRQKEHFEEARRADDGDWRTLLYRLKAMAKLWQPSADNPAIHRLTQFNALQNVDVAAFRATLDMASAEGAFKVVLDGWTLRIVPNDLHGFLLMDCCSDVAAQVRFRLCGHCQEWFRPRRSDNLYCMPACRQAHHAAVKGAA
jgi:hypothetical protein